VTFTNEKIKRKKNIGKRELTKVEINNEIVKLIPLDLVYLKPRYS
jgi:hypothetical protein